MIKESGAVIATEEALNRRSGFDSQPALISRIAVRVKRTSNDTREGMERLARNEAADRHIKAGNRYKRAEILSYIVINKHEIEFVIEVT